MLAFAAQFFFGGWFFYNGLNYFVEFTPPPPGSSPATRDLMAGLEQTGMFALVKAVELATGAALLANRFVPLAAIVAFPVTFAIAWVMIVVNGGAVGWVVGTLALGLNGVILLARIEHVLPLLVFADRAPSASDPPAARSSSGRLGMSAHLLGAILGVGLSAGIELATMAHFEAVARNSRTAAELSETAP